MKMENTTSKIEEIKKQERTEKIVVLSLLVLSLALVFFAFSRNGNISASVPNDSSIESHDGNSHEGSVSSNDMNEGGTNSSNIEDIATDLDIETIDGTATKEGVLVVGLFSSSENAQNVKLDLDSLGFSGIIKTRDDGKLMVGVEADKKDDELMNSVKASYSDAIFIKN